MNISLEHYRLFYFVAKYKNFTLAADKLLISQPALSQMIKKLENELGCILLIRNKKGISLTQEGEILYKGLEQAMDIISNCEDKIVDLKNLNNGILNIGTNHTISGKYLMPFIKEFNEMYPNIKINLISDTTNNLMVKARNGVIDLIIKKKPDNLPKDFDYFKLYEINDCFMASNKYIELKNKKIHLKDLDNYPLLLINNQSGHRESLDFLKSKYNVILKPTMEFATINLVEEYTVNEMGIGYLTYEHLSDENKDKLFKLDIIEDIKFPKDVCLITYKERIKTTAGNTFINFIKDKYK